MEDHALAAIGDYVWNDANGNGLQDNREAGISGDHEGHRFDIVSASANTITVAEDSDIHAAAAPLNTLAGAAPAMLVGGTIAVRRHWTLADVFPPAAFIATNSQSSADQIQVLAPDQGVFFNNRDTAASLLVY